jgi:hypothetical protein
MDPGAITTVIHKDSPAVLLDTFSGSATNTVKVIIDWFSVCHLSIPAYCVPVVASSK